MAGIALLGFGTVAGATAQLLAQRADAIRAAAGEAVTLQYILVRREKPGVSYPARTATDFSVIERDPEVRIVIEAIGGTGAALDYCRRALKAGKHVVTANKQMLAEYGHELTALALENGVQLLFEPSVGGGTPLLHPLRECFGASPIRELAGVLNGTTNYILTEMLENGELYESALARAQKLGYAESDPTADVSGLDAARKICVLADLLTGMRADPARVATTGIESVTAEDASLAASCGMSIRLLARVIRAGEETAVFVRPHAVAGTCPLSYLSGVTNGLLVRADSLGETFFSGPGAGGVSTACAVLSDVIDILRNPNRPQPCVWTQEPLPLADAGELPMRFLIRTDGQEQDAQERLGHLRWFRGQGIVCGALTEPMTERALRASGLRLLSVLPVME